MKSLKYQSRVTSAICHGSSLISVKNHVSYQGWVTSAIRHESPQMWVTSRQGRVITRQWQFDEQLQRKMAFKCLITWCFLKKHSIVKASQYIRRKSIRMHDQWNEVWKYSDFLTLRLIGGKNWNVQNTDSNYLSPEHRYNTLVKNLLNRQSTS